MLSQMKPFHFITLFLVSILSFTSGVYAYLGEKNSPFVINIDNNEKDGPIVVKHGDILQIQW